MTNSATPHFEGAESLFNAGATVVSALIDKQIVCSDVTTEITESSLKTGDGWVILLTEIPSGSSSFTVRFQQSSILEVVKIMMGGGDDLGAIGESMTAEITSQIAKAIGEELANKNGWSPEGVSSKVCDDAALIPPPPLTTLRSTLTVGGEIPLEVALDFDAPTTARIGFTPAASAETTAAPQSATPATAATATTAETTNTSNVVAATPAKPGKTPQAAAFSSMTPTNAKPKDGSLDLVHDVPMTVRALLGSSRVQLREVVGMQAGTVFELNRSSEEPIDLFVNNILIARGEVVVVDDRYAVKIRELNPGGAKV